jgi:hypothetical protein
LIVLPGLFKAISAQSDVRMKFGQRNLLVSCVVSAQANQINYLGREKMTGFAQKGNFNQDISAQRQKVYGLCRKRMILVVKILSKTNYKLIWTEMMKRRHAL